MSADQLFGVGGIAAAARNREHVIITKFVLANPFRRAAAKAPGAERQGLNVGPGLLACAAALLAALAAAMGIVSWRAQYTFVFAVKHQGLAAALESLGLDAGAVIFAVLGIALACLGRRAVIERALVALCAAGSCGMNLLGANLGSPRSIAVYVMPPVLFALGSDRLTAVIRRAALGPRADEDTQRSAWLLVGRAALYALRLMLAPPSTVTGARQALLNATPLPGGPVRPPSGPAATARPVVDLRPASAEGQAMLLPELPELDEPVPAAEPPSGPFALPPPVTFTPPPPPGGQASSRVPGRPAGKTSAFLDLARGQYGDLANLDLGKVGRISAELAPEVGLNVGSARTALRSAVLAAQAGGAR
jgi:hypothetical protein